jgi:hypothetical protein
MKPKVEDKNGRDVVKNPYFWKRKFWREKIYFAKELENCTS